MTKITLANGAAVAALMTSFTGSLAAEAQDANTAKPMDAGDYFVEAFKGLSDSNRDAQDAPAARTFDQITDRFSNFASESEVAIKGDAADDQPFTWQTSSEFGIAGAFEGVVGNYFESVSKYQSLFVQLQSDAVQLDALLGEAKDARKGQEQADKYINIVQLAGAGLQLGTAGYKWITSADEVAEAVTAGTKAADDVATGASGAAGTADTVVDAGGAITLPLPGASRAGETVVDSAGAITLPLPGTRAAGDTVIDGAGAITLPLGPRPPRVSGLADEGAETVVGGARAGDDAAAGVSSATQAPPVYPQAPTPLAEAIEPGVLRLAEEAGVDAQAILNQAYRGGRGYSAEADLAAEQAILVAIMTKQGGHRLAPAVENAARDALLKVQIALNNGDEAVDIAAELAVLRDAAKNFDSTDDFISWMSRAFADAFDDTGIDLLFNAEQLGMLNILARFGDNMPAIRQAVGPVKLATTGATAQRSGIIVSLENKLAAASAGGTLGGTVTAAIDVADGLANPDAPSGAPANGSGANGPASNPNIQLFEQIVGATPNIFSLAGGFNSILGEAAGPARIERRAEGYSSSTVGYTVAAGREAVEFLTNPLSTASDWGYSSQITDVFGQFAATYRGEFTALGNYTQDASFSLDRLQTIIDRADLENPDSLFGGRGERELDQMLTELDEAYLSASAEWQKANKARYTAMRNQILKTKEDLEKFITMLSNLGAELPKLDTYLDIGLDAGNGRRKTGTAVFDPNVFIRLTSVATALGTFRDGLTLQSDGKPPARVIETSAGSAPQSDTALVDYIDPSWYGENTLWTNYWTLDDCHIYEGNDYGPCGPTPEPEETDEDEPVSFGDPRFYGSYGGFNADGFGSISAGTLVPSGGGDERALIRGELDDWTGWNAGGSIRGPEIFGKPSRFRIEYGQYEADFGNLGFDPEGGNFGVALSYNEEITFGTGSSTGLFLGDPFALDGSVQGTGDLFYLKGGLEELKWVGERSHVTMGANLLHRRIETEMRSTAAVQFGGSPFGNIAQDNQIETEIDQIGAMIDAQFGYTIAPRDRGRPGLSVGFGGALEVFNSDSSGEFSQLTRCDPAVCGADLSNVAFSQSYDESGIEVGGSINVGASVELADYLTLSAGYQYGIIPGGAEYQLPVTPDDQPGGWQGSDYTYDGFLLRVIGSF